MNKLHLTLFFACVWAMVIAVTEALRPYGLDIGYFWCVLTQLGLLNTTLNYYKLNISIDFYLNYQSFL